MKVFCILFLFVTAVCLNPVEKIRSIYTQDVPSFNTGVDSPEHIGDVFFPDELFSSRNAKILWLDKVDSYFNAYSKMISRLEYRHDEKKCSAYFFLKNGDQYHVSNVKYDDTMPEKYHYPENGLTYGHSGVYFFSNDRYDFFHSIYGKDNSEIRKNLVTVNVFGKSVSFNKKNDAALHLQNAVYEITNASLTDENVRNWISGIKNTYTYSDRTVANEDRPSFHGFGIAIDFVPAVYANIYWLWSAGAGLDWWNIKDDEKYAVPRRVVAIFEENGFCWGGKWTRFDNMHFEYRPEIIPDFH
jgi:hypothetical protein